MNAYLVDAGEVYVCQEYLGELGAIYGMERVIDIMLAETRGKAKYAFWQRYADDLGGLTEHTYRTRLLRKNVPVPTRGVEAFQQWHELWGEVAAAEEKRTMEKEADAPLDR